MHQDLCPIVRFYKFVVTCVYVGVSVCVAVYVFAMCVFVCLHVCVCVCLCTSVCAQGFEIIWEVTSLSQCF